MARHRRFDYRLVTFNFVRQVKDADATLLRNSSEVPVMLQKCVRAYLDYALHKCRSGTSGTSQEVLHRRPQEIEEQVSPLDKYLNSSEVIVDQTHACHCPSSGARSILRGTDVVSATSHSLRHTRGPFSARGSTVERMTMTWGAEGRLYEDEDFAVGVTVKE